MLAATGTAQLYLQHIWKHHGLPKKVVSDRGPQFIAEFTKELYQILRIKLVATTCKEMEKWNGSTKSLSSIVRGHRHHQTSRRVGEFRDN